MQTPSPLVDKRFADREVLLTSRTGVPHTVPSAAMMHDAIPPFPKKGKMVVLAPAGSRFQGKKAPHPPAGNTHRYPEGNGVGETRWDVAVVEGVQVLLK